jgi:hypothetical protein
MFLKNFDIYLYPTNFSVDFLSVPTMRRYRKFSDVNEMCAESDNSVVITMGYVISATDWTAPRSIHGRDKSIFSTGTWVNPTSYANISETPFHKGKAAEE